MKLGAVYPQTELRGDPRAVTRIGTGIEALGFDYLLAYDHVVGATHDREPKLMGPYTDQDPFHDPLVMFAYLAGITQRIELVCGVLILPQRQTVLVARQAADLDLLSGGRLRLGIGLGWNYVEYDALGQDFKTRGRRASEQIPLLRRLWTEPSVTFQGEFDHLDRVTLNPRPTRPIPIWFGGFSEPAYRRAAHLGDGFILTGAADKAAEAWGRIEHHLKEAGRAAVGFGKEMVVGRQDKTPQQIADRIQRCREWGCTHVAVDTMGKGFTTADAHINFLSEVLKSMSS